MLIGILASIAGLAAAAFLEQDRCLDAGGRWDARVRRCEWVGGAVSGLSTRSIVLGLIVAVVLAAMLYRALLFLETRAIRRID